MACTGVPDERIIKEYKDMAEAKMDRYGTRGLLGNGETETVPIRATQDGSLYVTENGVLKQVVSVDLTEARDGELIYDGEFSELTFAVVDVPVKINFTDDTPDKYVTITGKSNISAAGNQLHIRNAATEGKLLEVWVWR